MCSTKRFENSSIQTGKLNSSVSVILSPRYFKKFVKKKSSRAGYDMRRKRTYVAMHLLELELDEEEEELEDEELEEELEISPSSSNS